MWKSSLPVSDKAFMAQKFLSFFWSPYAKRLRRTGRRETALRGKFVRSYCALLFSGGEEQSRDCFSLALTQRPTMGETVQIFEEEARRIFWKIYLKGKLG